MNVVIAPNFAGWNLAGAEVTKVRITRVKLGRIGVVVFGNIDRAVIIDAFNPEHVAPRAAIGLANGAL